MTVEKSLANPKHFEEHHEGDSSFICMQDRGACSVLLEFSDEQKELLPILEQAAEMGLIKLDEFFGGDFARLFSGLHIKFSEYPGGGEAFKDTNEIIFDSRRMAMSLVEAEAQLVEQGVLNSGDWTSTVDPSYASEPGSCLYYNLIHEVGHLLDERAEDGSWQGIPTDQSPTKYGSLKRNEAGAEAFTYLVLGQTISQEAEERMTERIAALRQLHPSD